MKKIVVGVLAHVDSGKTTLSEAMLYKSGSINKLGRVDHKDSFLDTFSLERQRGITIFSKQAILDYNDTRFTLLDTPGHVDFSAETERTLQVIDYAILVISASNGVQSHTKTLWNLLAKYNVPCFIFVNKTDLEGVDTSRVLLELKTKLSQGCVDFSSDDDTLFEEVALCSNSLLDKYSASGTLQKSDIVSAIKQRKVFPCLFGSALKMQGVEHFLNCLHSYTQMPNYSNDFAAKVYKISEDKGQRLSFLKITGGSLKVKDVLQSDKNKNGEKVNQIRIYSGDKFKAIDEAFAGTVCAVTGVTFTQSGDGLGKESNASLPLLEPVFTYGLRLPDGVDSFTALKYMRVLESEDPQLKVVWNERLGEIQVQLMGDIQLEVLQSIIADRFNINVEFTRGNIIYKETIADTVEGIGHFEPLRHYAEVHLILKPTQRDSGLVFNTDCKEDLLDKNWQRLILTHLYEKTHIGVLTGSPITDMQITLASGKAHPKHTEGGDFRQATYRAVRQGLRSANSILLEPVYDFTLEVPSENVGKAMTDIQRMQGSFDSPETLGEFTVIKGSCPVATMYDYAGDVRAYTHGRGSLACSLKGYEPCHNTEQVIAQMGYDADADVDNTCDSVFCAHGAGYTVKWNEVKSRMHLPSALSAPKSSYDDGSQRIKSYAKTTSSSDLFALDKELMQIFERTYGPIKNRTQPDSYHFTFTESAEKKKPKAPRITRYDGVEYLLVDGYNVIFSWNSLKSIAKDSIESARDTLINILCNYQGYKKCKLILVFDAYKVKGNTGEHEKVNGIDIVYTKEAETADAYIEKVSYKLAKTNKVRVVTSDALEQLIILGNGALRVSANEFLYEVQQAQEDIRAIIDKTF